MPTRMPTRMPYAALLLAAAATVGLSSCGSDEPAPNAADRTFLQQMIPHHEQAIAVARIGISRATDPRVRSFATRIVREQTPELERLRSAADGQRVDLARGLRTAHHRIRDTEVAMLRTLRGDAFDRQFLALHIMSETGAAEMARTELRDGVDDAARAVARPISTAPDTQIPELRALLAALPR